MIQKSTCCSSHQQRSDYVKLKPSLAHLFLLRELAQSPSARKLTLADYGLPLEIKTISSWVIQWYLDDPRNSEEISHLPSGHWKILHWSMICLLKPSIYEDFPVPCLITEGCRGMTQLTMDIHGSYLKIIGRISTGVSSPPSSLAGIFRLQTTKVQGHLMLHLRLDLESVQNHCCNKNLRGSGAETKTSNNWHFMVAKGTTWDHSLGQLTDFQKVSGVSGPHFLNSIRMGQNRGPKNLDKSYRYSYSIRMTNTFPFVHWRLLTFTFVHLLLGIHHLDHPVTTLWQTKKL